jgi:transposase-like protein
MKRILIAAVLSSLATAAVIAATGIAQNDNSDRKPPPTMKQALADAEKQRDAHLARIAKRLDVSTEKLKDSIDKVRDAQLDEAVDAGRLTDAQRDAIKACKDNPLTCDRSNLPAPRLEIHRARRGADERGMRLRFRGEREDFFEDLAKELGKDADDVEAAFRAERPRFGRRLRGPGGPPPGGPDGPGPGGPGFFGGPGSP